MILLNKPIQPDLKKLTSYLKQIHESNWYTNFGPLHQQLTERLEEYLGVQNLLLVSNGTLAIQVACKALEVESALTTPFSFVATTSSLLWQKMRVAFCDIDKHSLNISPAAINNALETEDQYDNILATHVYGNPCDVQTIQAIANKHNKKVIYDAAHAFGVCVDNQSVLNFGDASTLSFHATKVFHTVEGGAIVFKKREDYLKAKELINFGIRADGSLGRVGINAKLNEYQSAVGLTLLDNIKNVLEHRVALFELYRKELNNVIDMPVWHEKASMNGAYMPICCESEIQLEYLLKQLSINGVQSRKYFAPSLDLAYLNQKSYGCKISNDIAKKMICLPLHYYMLDSDIRMVSHTMKRLLQ